MLKEEALTREIVGAAIDVHRELGPVLLEGVYEECLAFAFSARGLSFERQLNVPLSYKGNALNANLRIDLFVERRVVVGLKSTAYIPPADALPCWPTDQLQRTRSQTGNHTAGAFSVAGIWPTPCTVNLRAISLIPVPPL